MNDVILKEIGSLSKLALRRSLAIAYPPPIPQDFRKVRYPN